MRDMYAGVVSMLRRTPALRRLGETRRARRIARISFRPLSALMGFDCSRTNFMPL